MKAGHVAFLGRPNAGKSTLLNRIMGVKIAIVSDKPQTTRRRIMGVKNYPDGQVAFVDTPGVHRPMHRLNVRMVDVALDAMREVDVVALVIDASTHPGTGDRFVLKRLAGLTAPTILVLNKVDVIAKVELLPMIEGYRRAYSFAEIVPASALFGTNIELLERLFLRYLPGGDPIYPADYLTDQPERAIAGELVREQVLRLTRAEMPFSTAVVVDRFEEPGDGKLYRLFCSILVDRESQKPIVVGKGGAMIKEIGTAARHELERSFGAKVYLDLHVKVKRNWRDDERVLDEIDIHRER
jgi:GTP-binding protein Era